MRFCSISSGRRRRSRTVVKACKRQMNLQQSLSHTTFGPWWSVLLQAVLIGGAIAAIVSAFYLIWRHVRRPKITVSLTHFPKVNIVSGIRAKILHHSSRPITLESIGFTTSLREHLEVPGFDPSVRDRWPIYLRDGETVEAFVSVEQLQNLYKNSRLRGEPVSIWVRESEGHFYRKKLPRPAFHKLYHQYLYSVDSATQKPSQDMSS